MSKLAASHLLRVNEPSELPFWQRVGVAWRQLAGDFRHIGFSFEWQEWDATEPLNWAESFHPHSVELCLNLQGAGWVQPKNHQRMEFAPGTAGFFVNDGDGLAGQRLAGRHQFVSLEFSILFLNQRLSGYASDLHPSIRSCITDGFAAPAASNVIPLTHRHQDMLRALLHPPVLASAQRLWFETKALEFAAEFLFVSRTGEPLCTRAQRIAAERIARAQAVLLENLAEAPSLEELGRRVGCSSFYLSRTFSQQTGLTISQWLRRARLQRAAALLASGKYNVTEAALEVGYSSLSHFSQAFHEMHGCCPGLYPLRTPAQAKRTTVLRQAF